MNQTRNPENAELLLILTVSPGLEEAVVDWLISRPESAGFTSFPAHGHGSRHSALSQAEQVAGRQKRVQFEVGLPSAGLDDFLHSMRTEFTGTDLHYWVIPVMESGSLAAR